MGEGGCRFFGSTCFSKSSDYFSQGEKTLVDVNRFFLSEALSSGLRSSLTSSQVNQLELGGHLVVNGRVVGDFEVQSENTMRPGRGMIQVVGGYDFVLDAFVIVLEAVFSIVAFENIQIFNLKLVSLAPSYSKTVLFTWHTA